MKMSIYHYFKHGNNTMPMDKYWQRNREREVSKSVTAMWGWTFKSGVLFHSFINFFSLKSFQILFFFKHKSKNQNKAWSHQDTKYEVLNWSNTNASGWKQDFFKWEKKKLCISGKKSKGSHLRFECEKRKWKANSLYYWNLSS